MLITDWTVDYGGGAKKVIVPHVWGQDMPLLWEGPAVYRTKISVPALLPYLIFHGVSYETVVLVNGEAVVVHHGIWDAFTVDLSAWIGSDIDVEVRVVKNGGATYPVREVLSGFLPYVFGTFGGIFREVELSSTGQTVFPHLPVRVKVEGAVISVDGQAFSPRGTLSWGWYPETGNPHPPLETIRKELDQIQALGFNLVKFCLWMPPHSYLGEMKQRGMMAWLELPLWDPKADSLDSMREEILRVAEQYAHHDNVLAWTIGCELSDSTTPKFRQEMVEAVRQLTSSPLVKDNSGGAEMYGGSPLEFGTFDDFHPYCDTHFYPVVLDSLLPGARKKRPILLGEFNDYDGVRNFERVRRDQPYWAANSEELNAVGVRWQYDMPALVESDKTPDFSTLGKRSRAQRNFILDTVQRQVAARQDLTGWVVTGLRDTPISSAGIIDDWGESKATSTEFEWNQDMVLFALPRRSPPFLRGGNRPGWEDPWCHWSDRFSALIGLRSTHPTSGELKVQVGEHRRTYFVDQQGDCESHIWAEIHDIEVPEDRSFTLTAEYREVRLEIPIHSIARMPESLPFKVDDPRGIFEGIPWSGGGLTLSTHLQSQEPGILFLTDEATVPMPFWRESCLIPEIDLPYEALWGVATDRAIDEEWLRDQFPHYTCLLGRLDTRTCARHCYIAKSGPHIITTLRPQGGHGAQPLGLRRNPAGWRLIRQLSALVTGP